MPPSCYINIKDKTQANTIAGFLTFYSVDNIIEQSQQEEFNHHVITPNAPQSSQPANQSIHKSFKPPAARIKIALGNEATMFCHIPVRVLMS